MERIPVPTNVATSKDDWASPSQQKCPAGRSLKCTHPFDVRRTLRSSRPPICTKKYKSALKLHVVAICNSERFSKRCPWTSITSDTVRRKIPLRGRLRVSRSPASSDVSTTWCPTPSPFCPPMSSPSASRSGSARTSRGCCRALGTGAPVGNSAATGRRGFGCTRWLPVSVTPLRQDVCAMGSRPFLSPGYSLPRRNEGHPSATGKGLVSHKLCMHVLPEGMEWHPRRTVRHARPRYHAHFKQQPLRYGMQPHVFFCVRSTVVLRTRRREVSAQTTMLC